MSSDKNPDQNPESLSPNTETSRKPQPVTLDLLPTEILLQISGEPGKDEDTISADEFKGLCLLSPPPSKVYLQLYYIGDNCGPFRQALRSANVKAMDRCAQFGAVPDTTWELPESDGCQCISECRHPHHRPIDELLEIVYLGKVPIEKGINALEWLLGRRFDMKEQKDQAWYEANSHCDHFPEFLITMLSKSPDRAYTEGICQMIKLVQSYGYSLPFAMNLDTYWPLDERDRLSPGLVRKPLDDALRSHCPPYFIEVIMQDYIRHRVDFSSIHAVPPVFMESWAGKHKFYRGEASDILEQKIKILAKYGILNKIEEEMLGSIVEALRSMTTPTKTSSITGVTDWDAQCCWDTLVKALRPFTIDWDVYTVDIWTSGEGDMNTWGDAHRYHRFMIDRLCSTVPGEARGLRRQMMGGGWIASEHAWFAAKIAYRLVSCMNCLRLSVMDTPNSNNCHTAIVAPLPEDYETARALLDEPEPEYYLKNSGATCSVGKIALHNVVLVGKAADMTNVSVFVKDTVDDLLEAFSSIRAGFLIGVDGTAPEESLAKPGDIVVAFPQGFQPGQIQFDVSETIASNRISTTFEMSHPSSCVKSVINTIQSPMGRQHWDQYLQHQSSRTALASAENQQPPERNTDKANKVLRGKVASSTRLLSDRDLANKVGCDSKIICFERAGASIKSRFPILTVCGILSSTSSCSPKLNESALRQVKMATVIYTMFVSHRISTVHLEDEHAFTHRFQYEQFDLESAGFRLVLLEKGVQSQLRCQLWQAYLDDNDIIPYEALSYSWGSQSTPREILADGKTLLITESLYEALWHLRKPHEDRMLWVDALCIDQNNIKERGHQVKRMAEIYGKADKVIIWLGYLSGNAAKLRYAITLFEDRVRKLPGIARKWPREDPRWKSQWEQVEEELGLPCKDELVDGFQSFMGKPWFSRVWILQEVANAKRTIVGCNLGEVPGWIFAIMPHAMNFKVTEQCQSVLDIMPHPSTPSKSRKETQNLTKEEHVLMKDLYAYIVGGEWPVHSSPASDIQDLQQKLPDISREKLQEMLESSFPTDLLEHFLCRQGLISAINDDYLLKVMHHGSSVMQTLLNKSTPLPGISFYVASECFKRFPDVFEDLLQRPDCTFHDMPSLVAEVIKHRPQFFNRLVEPYSNPEQLMHGALLEAIPRGLPTCQALLDKYDSPIKISKKMLERAVYVHRDIVQFLLEEARSPIEILENIFLQATPRGFHLIDESRKPIEITPELIRKSIIAGSFALQVALLTMESTIELEEDLFIISIKNGLRTLERVLARSTKPFNITKKVYGHAIEAGIKILSYLFPESHCKPKMTESYIASKITEICESSNIPFGWEILIFHSGKLQITDKLMLLAKEDTRGVILPIMSDIRSEEEDISDEVAISAIKRGPEAFMALLNKEGTNFRVTERIREVAIEHSYAFEALGLTRHSEVFTKSLNLDQCVLPGQHPRRSAHVNEAQFSESTKEVQPPKSANRVAK
ncbi:heterokaryon incompatibility protein [Fusarium coicis]|nr:heterokaryon incompatibility protein [Fusarium coicis]